MSDFIKVYSNKDISSMSDVKYIFYKIQKAIGTWLIPTNFDSIYEFVQEFYKINFGRSFGSGCYSEADLHLWVRNHGLSFEYHSTSNTEVTLDITFNDQQQFESAEIEVYLPSDRVGSGRCHYEALTEELVPEFWDSSLEIDKRHYIKYQGLPIPNWVLDTFSNLYFSEEKANKDLARYGFEPTTLPGCTNAWRKGETFIIKADKSGYDKTFCIVKSEGRFPSEQSWKSYREILISLRQEQLAPPTPHLVLPEEDEDEGNYEDEYEDGYDSEIDPDLRDYI